MRRNYTAHNVQVKLPCNLPRFIPNAHMSCSARAMPCSHAPCHQVPCYWGQSRILSFRGKYHGALLKSVKSAFCPMLSCMGKCKRSCTIWRTFAMLERHFIVSRGCNMCKKCIVGCSTPVRESVHFPLELQHVHAGRSFCCHLGETATMHSFPWLQGLSTPSEHSH